MVAKQISFFPRGCSKELVAAVVDDYLQRPWFDSPWIDWMLLDALIRHEAVAVADDITLARMDLLNPASFPRSGFTKFLMRGADQSRAAAIELSTRPLQDALAKILMVYAGLVGEGNTLSPTCVRETMVAAETTGVRWDAACYALIDHVIARNPAVWNIHLSAADTEW
jgi:hypothetical protein